MPKKINPRPKDIFLGDEEPIGAIVELHRRSTPRGRLANLHFTKLMFRYFEEINTSQCGWGDSFIEWLSMNGWVHLSPGKYEKVANITTYIAPESYRSKRKR